MLSRNRRNGGVATLAFAILSFAACSDRTIGTTTSKLGGPTVGAEPLAYVVPPSGSSVDAPQVLAVVGDNIEQVDFEMDGDVVLTADTAPFEWTLDPAAYANGEYVVTIVATQSGTERSMSIRLTLAGQTPSEEEEEEEGGDPPAPGDPTVQFVTPANGAIISAPTVMTVLGSTITNAKFHVDGSLVFDDSDAAFQYALNPAQLSGGQRTIRIDVTFTGGTQSHSFDVQVVSPNDNPAPPSEILTAIQNLQPGQWYAIPNSKLKSAAPTPVPDGSINGVIGAWSSGAYDTKRDRLIVWGGGHGDYAGNEVYVFSMKTFNWARASEPSPFPPGDTDNNAEALIHPDGAPVTRHTYDYIDYVPQIDRFFCGGGAVLWRDGQFGDEIYTYLFDFDAGRWETLSEAPLSAGIGTVSAVGADGRVWMHGMYGNAAALRAFDPTTKKWTTHAELNEWLGYARGAEIDPVTNKFVMVGQGQTRIWNLSNPGAAGVVASTSGAKDLEGKSYPGLAFDSATNRIVGWAGGSTVYTFNSSTLQWTSRSTSGVNTTPPAAAGNGTNGRWRYVPSLNVFVVVNSVDENVHVYRNS